VWAQLGRQRRRWERRRAWFDDDAFASRRPLFDARCDGFQTASPIVTIDAWSSAAIFAATACPRIR
jgi:hypothetical protein